MPQVVVTVSTRAGDLAIVRAGPDDIPAVVDIQIEAAEWLRSRGIDQWRLDRERTIAYLRIAITGFPPARTVFLVWRADPVESGTTRGALQPVATFSLQAADERVWGRMPDDALYLHGFAVRRAYGRLGVGLALLRWAELGRRRRRRGRQSLPAPGLHGREPNAEGLLRASGIYLSRRCARPGLERQPLRKARTRHGGPDRMSDAQQAYPLALGVGALFQLTGAHVTALGRLRYSRVGGVS